MATATAPTMAAATAPTLTAAPLTSASPASDIWPAPTLESWMDHPALKTAFDCLNIYNQWVSQKVIPIAVQWGEEHQHDVLDHLTVEQTKDVGAVIDAAFEKVRVLPKYEKGIQHGSAIRAEIQANKFDKREFNPIWTRTADGLHDAIKKALP